MRRHKTKTDRGPKNPLLTENDREKIIKRVIAGETQASLAREYGVTRQYVSILVGRAKKSGLKAATTMGKRGRPGIRYLTQAEEKKIHQIILDHKRPNDAGFRIRTRSKNVWDIDSVRKLVSRELLFSPGKTILLELLEKWDIAIGKPKGSENPRFSKAYYRYINSPIGKEVLKKSAERRKAQLELKKKQSQSSPKKTAKKFSEAQELEKIRKRIEASESKSTRPTTATSVASATVERTGKHNKGTQKKVRRKKR